MVYIYDIHCQLCVVVAVVLMACVYLSSEFLPEGRIFASSLTGSFVFTTTTTGYIYNWFDAKNTNFSSAGTNGVQKEAHLPHFSGLSHSLYFQIYSHFGIGLQKE